MLNMILMAAFAALVLFIVVQHQDKRDSKTGKIIEEAPMVTSLTVYKAASEGVGIATGAVAAVVVVTATANSTRIEAGAESLAKSKRFQNFGAVTSCTRTFGSTKGKLTSVLYGDSVKSEDHGINI
jgi:hypothetical protein